MPAGKSKSTRSPRTWWTLGAVVVTAGIVGAILLSGAGDPTSVEGNIGIDEPVRFKLASAGCGYSEVFVSSGETVKPEEGQFCVVRLEVRNLEEPIHQLAASCQYIIDGTGGRIAPRLDTEGLRLLADLEERLGPNEFRRASALHFDVPKSTEITAVELHASCASEGVRIPVPAGQGAVG